jgi:hypothetical protein
MINMKRKDALLLNKDRHAILRDPGDSANVWECASVCVIFLVWEI